MKSSYRSEWSFPCGSLNASESPDAAAQRELDKGIGLASYPLRAVGSVRGDWDGRQDQVHFFDLHLDAIPELRIDHREIVAAQLASPEELRGIALTRPVAAYLNGRLGA